MVELTNITLYAMNCWVPLCVKTQLREETFGQARSQDINLKYLKQYYTSIILSEESTKYEKIIKARCYIMILFGKVTFCF